MSDELGFDIDSAVNEIAESMGIAGDSGTKDAIDDGTGDTEPVDDNADNEQEGEAKEPLSDDVEIVAQTKQAPSSWAKDKHATWDALPDDAKDYVSLREKQMLDGIEQYKDGFQYAQYIDQAIAPYREVIRASGGDEATAIMNLFEHHRALTEGTLEQRQQALIAIGVASGLIPQENAPKADPLVSQLRQEVESIKRNERARQERAEQIAHAERVQFVEQFSKGKPDFDELSDSISQFIKMGHTLEAAYEKAKWDNPRTRAIEIARLNSENSAKMRQEAEKAKKAASINIKASRDDGKPARPLGSWDQTMDEVLMNIRGRV